MVGIVLAGGAGSRMASEGKPKPCVLLRGRPLIGFPLRALGEVCDAVAVVCKASTELPPLPGGVQRWDEPDAPRHPLTGIVFALESADAAVLVCAADMPFVDAPALRALLAAAGSAPAAPAVVARSASGIEPALGLYRPAALPLLSAEPAGQPLRRSVEALDPVRVWLAPEVVRSVNTPAELAAAEAGLS